VTEEPTAAAEDLSAQQASAPESQAESGPESGPEAPPAAKDPWDDPRLPWEGKPRRADILLWAGITLSGLYYLVLLPFRANLVGTHPVLLELLNGSTEAIISAAAFARVGHGSLAVALVAGVFGVMKFDLLYWFAGRMWGERIILLLSGRRKHGPKFMARVHRWGRKFTWPAMLLAPFLPLPSPLVYAVAGWAGMSWITFLILDLISELAWVGMLAGLGYALGHHAVVVAETISHYGLWISIALVVIVVALQVRSGRMHR
jgi:membrane-associated protein